MHLRFAFVLTTLALTAPPARLVSAQTGSGSPPALISSVSIYDSPAMPDIGGHSFLGSILSGRGFTGVLPNLKVCVRPAGTGFERQACTAVCKPGHQCLDQPFPGRGVFFRSALTVDIYDLDRPGSQHLIVESGIDPASCTPSQHCKIDVPDKTTYGDGAAVEISFGVNGVSSAKKALPAVDPANPGGTQPLPDIEPGAGGNTTAPQKQVTAVPARPDTSLERPKVARVETKLSAEGIATSRLRGQPFIAGANECCIHYDDVRQGLSGNCFLLSALAAIANVSPGTIKKAITTNSDGTYDVTLNLVDNTGRLAQTVVPRLDNTFPVYPWNSARYWSDQPFIYAQPGDWIWPSLPLFSKAELWVMLIEKAYAQEHGGYLSDSYRTGEAPSYAMQTITGKPSEKWLVAPNPAGLGLAQKYWPATISTEKQLDGILSKAVVSHRAIVAGTIGLCSTSAAKWVDASGNPTDEFRCTVAQDKFFQEAGGPLIRDHAYYLISYASGKLSLGNPWGTSIEVTLQAFMHAFRQLHINAPDVSADCTCN